MSLCKLYTNDTSPFSKIINASNSQNTLNSGLLYTSNLAYIRKMQFNPDPKKPAKEIIFPWKSNIYTYTSVTFNNNMILACPHQKPKGVVLDSKLEFSKTCLAIISAMQGTCRERLYDKVGSVPLN